MEISLIERLNWALYSVINQVWIWKHFPSSETSTNKERDCVFVVANDDDVFVMKEEAIRWWANVFALLTALG